MEPAILRGSKDLQREIKDLRREIDKLKTERDTYRKQLRKAGVVCICGKPLLTDIFFHCRQCGRERLCRECVGMRDCTYCRGPT